MAVRGSLALYSVRSAIALAALENNDQPTLEKLIEHEKDQDLLNEILYQASKGGFTDCARTLVQYGADVNYCESSEDETVLGVSCIKKHPAVTSLLVKVDRCNVNIASIGDQHTPLHACAGFNSPACCHVLLEAGANVNVRDCYESTPLIVACMHNNPEVVQELLQAGADISLKNIRRRDCFSIAMDEGHAGCVRELLLAHPDLANTRGEGGLYPLTRAIRDHQSHVVRAFIDAGCDVNCPEAAILTPLHMAIEVGDSALVEALVEGGADVNSPLTMPLQGATPLILAVVKEQADVVRVLAKSTCNLDAFDSLGRTALYLATKHRAQQCMRELLWAGANPDAYLASKAGPPIPAPTALHAAVLYDCCEEAVMLIQAGCDIDFPAVYEHGMQAVPVTPMMVACQQHRHWALKLLLLAGSNCLQPVQNVQDLNDEIVDLLTKAHQRRKNPDSLKCLCRTLIRNTCGRAFLRSAQLLPLPSQLISYLMFEELLNYI